MSTGSLDALELPRSPAVARNKEAIAAILRSEFAESKNVLEIGSGSGEHAVHFAEAFPWLSWQPSDRPQYLPGIAAWCAARPRPNLGQPFELDVKAPPVIATTFDAVFSANTAHIMSIDEVESLFRFLPTVLTANSVFCLYGPFKLDGQFTSESNADFDRSLRGQKSTMGIRDLEALDDMANDVGFARSALHPMPANNFIAVWRRKP